MVLYYYARLAINVMHILVHLFFFCLFHSVSFMTNESSAAGWHGDFAPAEWRWEVLWRRNRDFTRAHQDTPRTVLWRRNRDFTRAHQDDHRDVCVLSRTSPSSWTSPSSCSPYQRHPRVHFRPVRGRFPARRGAAFVFYVAKLTRTIDDGRDDD